MVNLRLTFAGRLFVAGFPDTFQIHKTDKLETVLQKSQNSVVGT